MICDEWALALSVVGIDLQLPIWVAIPPDEARLPELTLLARKWQ